MELEHPTPFILQILSEPIAAPTHIRANGSLEDQRKDKDIQRCVHAGKPDSRFIHRVGPKLKSIGMRQIFGLIEFGMSMQSRRQPRFESTKPDR